VFQLSSVLYFIDGTKSEEFLSKPFRVITAKPRSKAEISNLPTPALVLGDTRIVVHTLVSDRVFASRVEFMTLVQETSLDLSAAKVLLLTKMKKSKQADSPPGQ